MGPKVGYTAAGSIVATALLIHSDKQCLSVRIQVCAIRATVVVVGYPGDPPSYPILDTAVTIVRADTNQHMCS